MKLWRSLALLVAFAACSEPSVAPPTRPSHRPRRVRRYRPVTDPTLAPTEFTTRAIRADPQRPGDAALGYRALVDNGYVSCGIPTRIYRSVFGAAPAAARLAGRDPRNANLPYGFTALTSPRGADIVSANCLSCHASVLRGHVVLGLGDAAGDFTHDTAALARAALALAATPSERAELALWSARLTAVGDYTTTLTVGVNPADNLTAALFAHRDPRTLAWSDAALLAPPPAAVVPVDVPPWWNMRKKNAMFYNGSGRGDHARLMMTASALCTDSVAEAAAIDAYFPHVRAYLQSIAPPAWPFAVDRALAERGRVVFERACASCHGTYGDHDRYPNLLVGLRAVGTDPALARDASQFSERFVAWFRGSFYGERARVEPQAGYVAPPLDGVWATAPYLHNGSVPTVAALLDSRARPRFWTRDYADSRAYDPAAMGWRHTVLDHGQRPEDPRGERTRTYDTTLPGYGNGGHTYGDELSADERREVIEYLKTL